MSFSVTLDPSLRQAAVPILILQPLAENAVRHGVEQASTINRVEVLARRIEDRLELQVSNHGSLAAPRVEGIGVRNTRERLRALYGDNARFALVQSGDRVFAVVDLPFVQWS
jgi:LytS/YehU family sensor histidine kinase